MAITGKPVQDLLPTCLCDLSTVKKNGGAFEIRV